jgi:hypothetical protein
MSQTISAVQIADYVLNGIARWTVENIAIELVLATKEWTYYSLEWNDEEEDWDMIKLKDSEEASELCEITLPKRFYI